MQPEDVVNNSLDLIGSPVRIASFYDGTREAIVARDVYAQTRDAAFHTLKPIWAHKDAALTLLKSAPNIVNGTANYNGVAWSTAYPELPWLYEYQWPADCLLPLQIKSTPLVLPIWRPRDIPFRPVFDTPGNNTTLLTNEPNAILVYVAQVLNPNDWHSDFVEVVIAALAKKLEAEFAKVMPRQEAPRADAPR